MKKSLEPGLFLIKKENLRLKEENSKVKARVENIENKLRESKLFELLFPVVVASMLTVWDMLFYFSLMSLYLKKVEMQFPIFILRAMKCLFI